MVIAVRIERLSIQHEKPDGNLRRRPRIGRGQHDFAAVSECTPIRVSEAEDCLEPPLGGRGVIRALNLAVNLSRRARAMRLQAVRRIVLAGPSLRINIMEVVPAVAPRRVIKRPHKQIAGRLPRRFGLSDQNLLRCSSG